MKNTLHALLALALAAALPAHAQSAAESRSLAAQAALSERYTQLWTRMPAEARSEFARRERHWLHATRWREQQRCIDAHAAGLPPAEQADWAAHCLAEITLRRLATLPPASLAAAH